MLRFAPSPTGDMHIGNLRIALFNYICSVQREEPLLIRIEDTDNERNIPGKEKEIFELLALFSIEYQEQQLQSNNVRFHRAMALQLLQDKKAFNCFCPPDTLDTKREAAKKSQTAYRYDGACENLLPEEVIDNPLPFTIRLKKPSEAITVSDLIQGESTFTPDEIDSFVLLRADKYPTHDFACAVDDMLADISLIIRGEDHLSNTPKQIAIQEALGYTKKIEYAHLPVILGDDGEKLSQNDEASSIKWLLSEGYLPEAITNYLIGMGNNTPLEISVSKRRSNGLISEPSPNPLPVSISTNSNSSIANTSKGLIPKSFHAMSVLPTKRSEISPNSFWKRPALLKNFGRRLVPYLVPKIFPKNTNKALRFYVN